MPDRTEISRRSLITGAAAAASISSLPSQVLGRSGSPAPSDKLNIAFIGIGGHGVTGLKELSSQNIVALCDVDWRTPAEAPRWARYNFASKVAPQYPQAKRFDDWRVMLQEMDKSIDAVLVCTADHTHAVAALTAMKMGKHVYCEKPLAHSVHDVQAMMKAERKYPRQATQTGIQGHASEDVRSLVEWVRDGAIGTIAEAHVFQSGPKSFAGRVSPYADIAHIGEEMPIPPEVKWDLFLGPAPARKYNPMYTPVQWRKWIDFGTGILGDHGPHYLDPACWALDLGLPETIEAETDDGYSDEISRQVYPQTSRVRYTFPAKGKCPAVKLTWYGEESPPVPKDWDPSIRFPQAGGILLGSKGTIVWGNVDASPTGTLKQAYLMPEALNKSYKRPEKTLPRPASNWLEWVECAKAGTQPAADFAYGGNVTKIALLGDIAIRNKGQRLRFDPATERFTNSDSANAMLQSTNRAGWPLPI